MHGLRLARRHIAAPERRRAEYSRVVSSPLTLEVSGRVGGERRKPTHQRVEAATVRVRRRHPKQNVGEQVQQQRRHEHDGYEINGRGAASSADKSTGLGIARSRVAVERSAGGGWMINHRASRARRCNRDVSTRDARLAGPGRSATISRRRATRRRVAQPQHERSSLSSTERRVGLAAPGTLRIAMRRCVQGINYDQPESICACGVFGELERRFCIRSGRTRGPASWKLIGHLRRQRRRGSNQRHLQLQTRVSVGNRSGQRGLVGGTVGWNWQSGNWVFGVEGDLSATNIQGGTGGGNCGSSFICKAEIGWLGTARARLGLATMGNALFYVTGGALGLHRTAPTSCQA